MSKRILLYGIFSLILLGGSLGSGVVPVYAQEDDERTPGFLIVCDGPEELRGDDPNYRPCNMRTFFLLLENLMVFMIYVALFLSVFVFLYAGFLYLTSSDKRNQTQEAKDMMRKAVIGIILLLIAWVAVYALVRAFGLEEDYNYLDNVES